MKKIYVVAIMLVSMSLTAYGYDFFGSDISSSLVTTPNQCSALCDANAACRAWTFVRPPLKNPTSAVCFLKSAVPAPSLNATCTSNAVCLSGIKRTDMWCGESPARNAPGSTTVMGQGAVLSCPTGFGCGPKMISTTKNTVCWFLIFPYPCHEVVKIQTTDFFCLPTGAP
ncbi:MAG TPA: PAN/Apple domain-containing protein [Thermoanaerobaculia bacterium]